MFATVQASSKNDVSFRNLPLKAISGGSSLQRDVENFQAEGDTWDTYLSTLRTATIEAISAKKLAQREYLTVLAEEDRCEKRLETALNNDCEDLVCKALSCKTACRDKACHLKALVDKHRVQVSALKGHLLFWEDQLATKLSLASPCANFSHALTSHA